LCPPVEEKIIMMAKLQH